MSTQLFCGIALAKYHFSLHAVDDHGKVILHDSVSRVNLLHVKKDVYRLAPPKVEKVAITSCMRKMVMFLNLMLRDDVMWDKNLAKI
ncbi:MULTISPECIES: hypothetical protein [unclassified Salinivibrio]|uniref:hypothetical protein n=1 Tax=unclassified Salinivibrio TaxID=2636825 RepID=UPI0009843963|nr:hypothetical protein BZG83_15575 [Salinivibrio sp. PR919]OOF13544.1 hypothetical protein BZG84_15605 [Salinivibrio sp. PR932]